MELSLFFFASNADHASDNYRLLLDVAKYADTHGFTAIWTPERHFHPFGGAYPNPALASAALATITERIELRAGSVVAPLHDPIRIAEEWSVVDNLSGGRVGVAFASGWHTGDFVLNPTGYDKRRQLTLDTIDDVHALWRGESLTRVDGGGDTTEVVLSPPPLRPVLPTWLTSAGSPETFRMAGEKGLNVLTHLLGQTLHTLENRIQDYRAHYAYGRGDAAGKVTVMAHTFVNRNGAHARAISREPFAGYLSSSFDLLSKITSGTAQAAVDELGETDIRAMVDRAVDRYMNENGIFGTPHDAVKTIGSLRDIGVDEVACLIDFGLPHAAVMESLGYLASIRRLVR